MCNRNQARFTPVQTAHSKSLLRNLQIFWGPLRGPRSVPIFIDLATCVASLTPTEPPLKSMRLDFGTDLRKVGCTCQYDVPRNHALPPIRVFNCLPRASPARLFLPAGPLRR